MQFCNRVAGNGPGQLLLPFGQFTFRVKGAKSPFRVQSSSFLNFPSSENWTGSGAKKSFSPRCQPGTQGVPGCFLLKGPLCQEGAVAAGDWGRNPRRSVCRGGRPCPPLRTQAKCRNKLTALIPSVCAKRRQLPLMQSRGAFGLPKRSPAGRHGPPGGTAHYKVCSARPLSDD